jgi:hypothetical protein
MLLAIALGLMGDVPEGRTNKNSQRTLGMPIFQSAFPGCFQRIS